MAKVKSELLHR